jgi:hypothetical protein
MNNTSPTLQPVASIEIECATCSKLIPLPEDGTGFYWTPRGYEPRPIYCATCAVIHEAPLVKPQPKTTNLGCRGWDSQL